MRHEVTFSWFESISKLKKLFPFGLLKYLICNMFTISISYSMLFGSNLHYYKNSLHLEYDIL